VTGELDVKAALARRDEVTNNLDDSKHLPWLEERHIALFRGSARLDGERRVVVDDEVLVARDAVVLAPGSTAAVSGIPGLAEARAWTNRQITTTEEVPPRLTILGGGYVGVEMAQAWSSFGSQVTLIEVGDALLSTAEPFVGEEIGKALEQVGVTLRLGAKATSVSRGDAGITVELEYGSSVVGDRLLVAIGRKPLIQDLGLESVGLSGGGFIEVDDTLRVAGLPWLYAVGDVNGRSLLTHAGKYQARIAADQILGETRARAVSDLRGTPHVVFTDPEVAAVGMTLAAAQQAGVDALAIDLQTSGSVGASFVGRDAPGTSRFVVDIERQVLVGVTFVGSEANTFLQAASVAVVAEVPLSRLAHVIAPFPTRSELWLQFLEAYEREAGVSLHG
jgi:dihydrolipoamide dehydrogenase